MLCLARLSLTGVVGSTSPLGGVGASSLILFTFSYVFAFSMTPLQGFFYEA